MAHLQPNLAWRPLVLRRHLCALAAIMRTPALEYRVRQYFALGSGPFLVELKRAGLCHADIVLCLLRINTQRSREIVEALIQKPITVGPACRFVWPDNRQTPRVRRQPKITWVCSDVLPRRGTRLYSRFPEFRVGRSLQQLQLRGITRGDVKRAIRGGFIKMVGI